jgi:hypothetical protein
MKISLSAAMKESPETPPAVPGTNTNGTNFNKTRFFPAQTHKKTVNAYFNRIAQRGKTHHCDVHTRYQSHIQHALPDSPAGTHGRDSVAESDTGLA